MLVAAPVAARDQVRALLRGAGRGSAASAEADDEPTPPREAAHLRLCVHPVVPPW